MKNLLLRIFAPNILVNRLSHDNAMLVQENKELLTRVEQFKQELDLQVRVGSLVDVLKVMAKAKPFGYQMLADPNTLCIASWISCKTEDEFKKRQQKLAAALGEEK